MNGDSNWINILCTAIMIFWVFTLVFFPCELGKRMSNDFKMFDKKLGRCNVLMLSFEMQRMYLVFLSNTQQPKTTHCYGGIVCSRDSYKRVQFQYESWKLSNFLSYTLFFFIDYKQCVFILHDTSPIRVKHDIMH